MALRLDRPRGFSRLSLLLAAGWLSAVAAAGQQQIVPLEFSFSDPGARSMGFGGAFVALADDATAAFANPAGLVQLVRPEVSIEGRTWSYSIPYTRSGRVAGSPSGFGLDTRAGLDTAHSEADLLGVSFLSFAYPLRKGSLAIYRHQSLNVESTSATQGLFGGGSDCCQIRHFDQQTWSDLELTSYGLSGGYRVHERLTLGLGVVYHRASIRADVALFLPDVSPLGIFAPTSYSAARMLLRDESRAIDEDWTLTAGFLWHLSRSWTLGGVYRQGPAVGLANQRVAGEAGNFGVPAGEVVARFSGVAVELPSVAGFGLAFRAPSGNLTVTSQWDHVDYSSIVDSLELDDQTVDDADELHLGFEYVFLHSTPLVALRCGAWLDPDHQLRATIDDPLLRALLPRGKDVVHYSAGLGLAFERFQIDLGADLGDPVDTLSLSAIYSF